MRDSLGERERSPINDPAAEGLSSFIVAIRCVLSVA